MKIEHLLSLREGKTVEFKENSISSHNIIKTIVAFSNTAGGTLILGVRDVDRSLVGIDDPIKDTDIPHNLTDE